MRLGELLALLVECCRVLAALPPVERARRAWGPRPLLHKLRSQGRRTRRRAPAARARLRRAIACVDARLPGGANCYRRTLLEIALDRDASAVPLRIGLDARGGTHSGHAWIGVGDVPARRYDIEIELV